MTKLVWIPGMIYFFIINANNYSAAQGHRDLQNFRPTGFRGLNIFEAPKDSVNDEFSGIKVRIGGDFALQFQGIDHSTKSGDTLASLGNNFNLPTANLTIDVQLAKGFRLNLVSYLSSRHHPETWVKGGYIQVDNLDFIAKDFLSGLMNVMTIKTGLDEVNYGDVHFRRSDNARTIYNPFIGNYIMDGFSTEVFGELIFQKSGGLLVAGISNGKLNQSVLQDDLDIKPSIYGKLGYDMQINEQLRLRLTGSAYISPGLDNGQYLYSGDRTGSRYYRVMQLEGASDNFRSGRFSPDFRKFNAFQINSLIKWKGLELFGVYELVHGDQSEDKTDGTYTQLGAELLYRIGASERLYLAARYNSVSGKDFAEADKKTIDRVNIAAGWFLTNNVLMKMEYVSQNYSGEGWIGSKFDGGNFSGIVLEAVVSF